MGAVGRIALSVVGIMTGNPWIAMAANLAGSVLFPAAKMSVSSPQQDTPAYSTVNGFAATTVSGTTPIAVGFGTCMVFGNIVKAYALGEANNRMLFALCLAEYIGNPDPVLLDLWVGDKRFSDLSTFSNSRSDTKSWYEFYPQGIGTSVAVSNTGRKGISAQLVGNDEHVSYGITVLGQVDVSININHYSPAAGSQQFWNIYYRNTAGGAWQLLGSYSQFFHKFISYEVADGCGTSTNTESVEGYSRTTHTFSGLSAGELFFKVEAGGVTNGGNMLWEDVVILSDTGGTVSFDFRDTSFLLINLIKTEELSSTDFKALIDFGRSNPSDAINFLLSDSELGLNVGSELSASSFADAAIWCNINGRAINCLYTNIQYDQAIKHLLDASGLIMVKIGGYFKLLPDEDSSPVTVIDIDADVLPGSLTWGAADYQKCWNRLRVKYVDRDDNYAEQDILIEDSTRVDFDRHLREATVDLTAINSMQAAQRRGEQLFKKSIMTTIWASFVVGIRNSRIEPGDIFQLVHPGLGWDIASNKLFRCLTMDEVMDDNGRFGYQIYAEVHDPRAYVNDYDWHFWTPPVWTPPKTIASLPLINIDSVTNTVTANGGVWQSTVTIGYAVPTDAIFAHVELWTKPITSQSWQLAEVNSTGSIQWVAPESWIHWQFRLVPVGTDLSRYALSEVPSETYYPNTAPYWYPGWGGGRYGEQPYGV